MQWARLAGHAIIVDLASVTFLDTVGVAALATAWKTAQQHDTALCLAAARPNVARVLHLTGLTQLIALHPTVPDALAACITATRTDSGPSR